MKSERKQITLGLRLRIMFAQENTTDVWMNVSKEGDNFFILSVGVLSLLHLNTWNAFYKRSRFHVF